MATGVAKRIIRLGVVGGVFTAALLLSIQVFPLDIGDHPAKDLPGEGFTVPAVPTLPKAEGPPVAVIRLSKALPTHPRWQELLQLEESLLAEYAEAGEVVPAEKVPDLNAADLHRWLQDERNRLTQEYQRQLEVQEKAQWAQVAEQIERKKAQLAREFDAEINDKRHQLTAELGKRASSLQQEYQVKVIGLRVKLEMLDAEARARSEFSQQITKLQEESQYKLGALEKEYQAKLNQFTSQAEARYADLLEQYGNQLFDATELELEAKQQELEAELAEHLSILVSQENEHRSESSTEQQPRLAELAQRISELRGEIVVGIRKAGEAYAFRTGLKTVILTEEEVFDGVDISQEVIEAIRQEGSLSNEAGTTDNTQ